MLEFGNFFRGDEMSETVLTQEDPLEILRNLLPPAPVALDGWLFGKYIAENGNLTFYFKGYFSASERETFTGICANQRGALWPASAPASWLQDGAIELFDKPVSLQEFLAQ